MDGRTHGYHVISYGWLVDCLVRRVDEEGRGLAAFVRDEITGPAGLDFHIGLQPAHFHRLARAAHPSKWEQFTSVSGFFTFIQKVGPANLRRVAS